MTYEEREYGVEEEPNELDPIVDLDDEDEDEDDEEQAAFLAEDIPLTMEDEEEDEEIEKTPGVRLSGGSDVAVMSHHDRRREFPSVRRKSGSPRRGRLREKQRH